MPWGGCRFTVKEGKSEAGILYDTVGIAVGYHHFDGNWYRIIGFCNPKKLTVCEGGSLDAVNDYIAANKVPTSFKEWNSPVDEHKKTVGSPQELHVYKGYNWFQQFYAEELKKYKIVYFQIVTAYLTEDHATPVECDSTRFTSRKVNNNPGDLFSSCGQSRRPLFFDQYVRVVGHGRLIYTTLNPYTGEETDSSSPHAHFRLRIGRDPDLQIDTLHGAYMTVKFMEGYIKDLLIGPALPSDLQAVVDANCDFERENICRIEGGL